MKFLIYILLLFSVNLFGTNYYVSTSGSGSGDGSIGDPYILSQLTTSGYNAGDSIFLKRGDIFYGKLFLAVNDASEGNRIYLGAYGTGDKPILSSFSILSSWSYQGGGIYRTTSTANRLKAIVSIDDEIREMGKSEYYQYESHTSTSITDADLAIDPTGMIAVINTRDWLLSNRVITAFSNNSLHFETSIYSSTYDNRTYFLQGDTSLCTSIGDWTCDGTYFYMYFGANNPNDYTVKVSERDTCLLIQNSDYWTIENIIFEGATEYGFETNNNVDFLNINNCEFEKCNIGLSIAGNNSHINNCIFTDITNISIYNTASNVIIENCTIESNAQLEGAMWDDDGGAAIRTSGDSCVIQLNTINLSGYHGIDFRGDSTIVKYNQIDSACNVKIDGGGIYTANVTDRSRIIKNNFVYNSGSVGIYLDEYADSILVDSNLVVTANFAGVLLHKASHNTITNNLVRYCQKQLRFNTSIDEASADITYSNIQHNTIISDDNEYLVYYDSQRSDITSATLNNTINNNYFIDNSSGDNLYVGRYNNGANITYTFSDWKLYGYDINSTVVQTTPEIRYNSTMFPVTAFADSSGTLANGTTFTNGVTVGAFESVVAYSIMAKRTGDAIISWKGKIIGWKGKILGF